MPTQTTWADLGLPSAKQISLRADLPVLPAPLPGTEDAGAALELLRSSLGIRPGARLAVTTPVGERVIDDRWLAHVVEKRDAARERYANLVYPTLADPTEIWLGDYDGEKRERFLKFWRDGSKAMLVIVNLQKGGVLWNVVPMPIRSVDRQREGALLWKKYQ